MDNITHETLNDIERTANRTRGFCHEVAKHVSCAKTYFDDGDYKSAWGHVMDADSLVKVRDVPEYLRVTVARFRSAMHTYLWEKGYDFAGWENQGRPPQGKP
jgi:hypothetical protein